jgi:prepilin-type N-terminal cleavage/methylation domain-containing protein
MNPPHTTTSRPRPPRRRAFTLIEILAVIAIISILSGIVLMIAPAVADSQKIATTQGYIGTLGASVAQYKNVFGDLPSHDGAADDNEGWNLSFYANLSGLKVLQNENNKLRLVPYTEVVGTNGKPVARRSFITESAFRFNPVNLGTIDENNRWFVDGWDNPIAYRYNVIADGEMGKSWLSPQYLLISAGAKYHEPVSPADYFTGSMQSIGQVPDDYADSYRADNIVSWRKD